MSGRLIKLNMKPQIKIPQSRLWRICALQLGSRMHYNQTESILALTVLSKSTGKVSHFPPLHFFIVHPCSFYKTFPKSPSSTEINK